MDVPEFFLFHLTILIQVFRLRDLERIFYDKTEMTWMEALVEHWATIPEFSWNDEACKSILIEIRTGVLLSKCYVPTHETIDL
jgi:hypothetical protein